jgi:hypothetical protein
MAQGLKPLAWSLAILPIAQKSRSDGTMVARGFSPWT